jgi:hypothetical protein
MIVWKKGILALKPDLMEAVRAGSVNDRIAKLIEASKIDALAMSEQLLIQRD